jgi:hypothetical protein
VQLGQAIVAAGLHIGKTTAAPERLPRTLRYQPWRPRLPGQYRGQKPPGRPWAVAELRAEVKGALLHVRDGWVNWW